MLHAIVHAADLQDRDGGVLLIATLFGLFPFLRKLYADGGYQGPLFKKALKRVLRQVNLEIIEPGPEPSAITMRVHERGSGITEACGTGACVSAWAAVRWGLAFPVDGEILVHMDGGDATVRLHEPEYGHVTLIGPAVLIAHLQIEAP